LGLREKFNDLLKNFLLFVLTDREYKKDTEISVARCRRGDDDGFKRSDRPGRQDQEVGQVQDAPG
jgi:hypothetical protein